MPNDADDSRPPSGDKRPAPPPMRAEERTLILQSISNFNLMTRLADVSVVGQDAEKLKEAQAKLARLEQAQQLGEATQVKGEHPGKDGGDPPA